MTSPRKQGGTPSAPAFTLVEILVVMAIGVSLIAIAVGSFRGNDAIQCRAAAKSTAALFEEARQWAISTGASVRVLVHQDPSEPDRFGRFLSLVRSEPVSPPGGTSTTSGSADLWFPGTTLKFEGNAYFSPENSGSQNPPEPFQITLDKDGATPGGGTLWLSCLISPRGVCEQEGSHFIFRSGILGDDGQLTFTGAVFEGFTIQRTGKAVFFNPDDTLPEA